MSVEAIITKSLVGCGLDEGARKRTAQEIILQLCAAQYAIVKVGATRPINCEKKGTSAACNWPRCTCSEMPAQPPWTAGIEEHAA